MLLEKCNAKQAFGPVDLNAAAITGARVSMKGCEKVTVLISLGVSLTGAVVEVTLRQHNAASAGTSKDLASDRKYHKKVGSATLFTQVEPSVAAALKTHSTDFDINGGILAIEIHASDLDNANNFNWVSVDLADSSVAKLVSGVYVLSDTDFKPAYGFDI